MELDRLQASLATAKRELEESERLNNQLKEELKAIVRNEESTAMSLREVRIKFDLLKRENEQLKQKNEHILNDLHEQKVQNQYEKEDFLCRLTKEMASDRNEDVVKKFEHQIMSLTREKKQLLTHLHWLSRQQTNDAKCIEETKDVLKKLSLEEGNGNSNDTRVLARGGSANAVRGALEKTDPFKQDCSKNIYGSSANNIVKKRATEATRSTSQEMLKTLRGLKSGLLNTARKLGENNDLCDVIFQLSFKNLRHPHEPQTYSNWGSYDDSICMSGTSLSDRSMKDSLNCQYDRPVAFWSLQNSQPATTMGSSHEAGFGTLKRNSTSLSSPEIFPQSHQTLSIFQKSQSDEWEKADRNLMDVQTLDDMLTPVSSPVQVGATEGSVQHDDTWKQTRMVSITDSGLPVAQPFSRFRTEHQEYQDYPLRQADDTETLQQENLIW